MTENPRWQEFDPSTFTFIGRNDAVIKWALDYRWEHRLPQPKTVWLLGSGVIEPFTIAALPGLERATIVAVEVNPELCQIASELKSGDGVPWSTIAEKSQNREKSKDPEKPQSNGRPNSDLLLPERLDQGLNRLAQLGSLARLGAGLNRGQMQVSEQVRDSVQFLNMDAKTFLNSAVGGDVDIIGDFFVQININKDPAGPKYTMAMIAKSLEALNDNGFYIIGDTGRNLPHTLDHFLDLRTTGDLKLSSMVHAVNFGSGFTSSHYLLASKIPDFPGGRRIMNEVAGRLGDPRFEPLQITTTKGGLHQLWDSCDEGELNIAYVRDTGYQEYSINWNSRVYPAEKAIEKVVPNRADEFSETIIFPAQKPHLARAKNG